MNTACAYEIRVLYTVTWKIHTGGINKIQQKTRKTGNLLHVWPENQHHLSLSTGLMLIQEIARSLFKNFKAEHNTGATITNIYTPPMWMFRFTTWHVTTKVFPKTCAKTIYEGGYLSQWIFNVDKTSLLWERMPPNFLSVKRWEYICCFFLFYFTKNNCLKPNLYLQEHITLL